MSYPTLLYNGRAMADPFAARGNPNSMLTSNDNQSNSNFDFFTDLDDLIASALNSSSGNNSRLETQKNNDWFGNLHCYPTPSMPPLLSELSPLSTLSSSSAPSLYSSPAISPFSISSALPERRTSSDFDQPAQNLSGLGLETEPRTIQPSSFTVPPQLPHFPGARNGKINESHTVSLPLTPRLISPAPEIQVSTASSSSVQRSDGLALEQAETTQPSSSSATPPLIPLCPSSALPVNKPPTNPNAPTQDSMGGLCLEPGKDTTSRPACPTLSPFCALPNVQFQTHVRPSSQRLSGLFFDSKGGILGQPECTEKGRNTPFDCNRQEPCQLESDCYDRHSVAHSYPSIHNPTPVQEFRIDTGTFELKAPQANASYVQSGTESSRSTTCARIAAPRRAATATKRRLTALLQENGSDEAADMAPVLRLSKSARSKKGTPPTRPAKKRKVDSRDESDYEPEEESPRTSFGPKKRWTYADLVLENHEMTRPDVTRHFLLPPGDCDSCKDGLKRKPDLIRHLKATHLPRTTVCAKCKTKVSRGDALFRHEKTCKGPGTKPRQDRKRTWEMQIIRKKGSQKKATRKSTHRK